MAQPGRPARRRHPNGGGLAVLLYLVTALVLPVLHADTERLADTATYEAHHSALCLPLHDEAVCPTCGAHGAIPSSTVVSVATDAVTHDRRSLVPQAIVPPSPTTAPPPARAPPR
jgi:hypothetical protein